MLIKTGDKYLPLLFFFFFKFNQQMYYYYNFHRPNNERQKFNGMKLLISELVKDILDNSAFFYLAN